MRLVWMGLALIPYAALAGFDGWLHERSRRVPRIEQALHAGLALSLIVFVGAAFAARMALALAALSVFVVLECADEFGFHRELAARERHVHFAAYAALLLFVVVWQWQWYAP